MRFRCRLGSPLPFEQEKVRHGWTPLSHRRFLVGGRKDSMTRGLPNLSPPTSFVHPLVNGNSTRQVHGFLFRPEVSHAEAGIPADQSS